MRRMLKGSKHYDENIFLASMYVVIIALFNFMSGIFFITADPRIGSPTYGRMQELMPLSIYGLVMFASATLLICSVFSIGKVKSAFMLIGGCLGAISIGLYAAASTIGAVNLMIPSRYSLISVSCIIIAIAGGISLWRNRRAEKNGGKTS